MDYWEDSSLMEITAVAGRDLGEQWITGELFWTGL